MHTSWSFGVLYGIPIFAIFIAGLCYISRWAFKKRETQRGKKYGDFAEWSLLAFGSFAVATLLLLIGLVSYYPYSAQYHQWRETTGTVDKVSSRLLGGDDSITQRFVVRYTDNRERACDDTRCSLIKSGDRLTLTCKREWQFAGEDGWSCNYVRNESG